MARRIDPCDIYHCAGGQSALMPFRAMAYPIFHQLSPHHGDASLSLSDDILTPYHHAVKRLGKDIFVKIRESENTAGVAD